MTQKTIDSDEIEAMIDGIFSVVIGESVTADLKKAVVHPGACYLQWHIIVWPKEAISLEHDFGVSFTFAAFDMERLRNTIRAAAADVRVRLMQAKRELN